MDRLTNVKQQYNTDRNLNIRLDLHQRFSINQQGWSQWVFHNYVFPEKAKILELGCGNGIIWGDNISRIPQDACILLTDISEGMLQATKEHLPQISNIKYKLMNIEAINEPDESYDLVIANHMLYHVKDKKQALQEVKRVLRPGGTFYASTVGSNNLQELSGLLNNFDSRIDYKPAGVSFGFTLENGLGQLQQHFSEVIRKDYVDGLRITEAEPLLQYCLSLQGINNLYELISENQEKFCDYLKDIIHKEGAIEISKSAGILIAKK